jgi:hypothetical protein
MSADLLSTQQAAAGGWARGGGGKADGKRDRTMAALKKDMRKGGGAGGHASSRSGSESGTDALSVSQTEDSEFSDSGAGFLGGIGDFDKFLNNVHGHVTPGKSANDRKRKGSKGLDGHRAGKSGGGAAVGSAGAGKDPAAAIKTKTRLIAVYWLAQLGKPKPDPQEPAGAAAQTPGGKERATGGVAEDMCGEALGVPAVLGREVSEIDQRAEDREGSLLEEEKKLLGELWCVASGCGKRGRGVGGTPVFLGVARCSKEVQWWRAARRSACIQRQLPGAIAIRYYPLPSTRNKITKSLLLFRVCGLGVWEFVCARLSLALALSLSCSPALALSRSRSISLSLSRARALSLIGLWACVGYVK